MMLYCSFRVTFWLRDTNKCLRLDWIRKKLLEDSRARSLYHSLLFSWISVMQSRGLQSISRIRHWFGRFWWSLLCLVLLSVSFCVRPLSVPPVLILLANCSGSLEKCEAGGGSGAGPSRSDSSRSVEAGSSKAGKWQTVKSHMHSGILRPSKWVMAIGTRYNIYAGLRHTWWHAISHRKQDEPRLNLSSIPDIYFIYISPKFLHNA